MKKLFVLLLCLAALWGCNLKGSYYVENCQDFVVRDEGVLKNDYGVVYSITSTASNQVPVPMSDGQRYFLFFDILDADYHILLKNSIPVDALEAVPETDPVPEADDPVNIILFNISPYWLNFAITYYKGKESNYAHNFAVQYVREPATDVLCLTFYHDGNDENPASAQESSLDQVTKLFSIPLTGYDWTPAGVNFTCHVLQKNTEDAYEVVQHTYTTNN